MSAPTDSSDLSETPAGRPAKTDAPGQRKGSVSKAASTGWCCMECDVTYKKDSDMLLQCQYCERPKCISCLGMTKSFYKQLSGRENLPWFCDKCIGKAIESVKTSKSIEDRCNDFLAKFQEHVENRFQVIEDDVAGVKQSLAEIKSGKGSTVGKETSCAPEVIVKQATTELQSRIDRKNNIAFFGVKEQESNLRDECIQLDTAVIIDLCAEIGVAIDKDDVKQVKRHGKKGLVRSITDKSGNSKEVTSPRVMVGTFTEETKMKIMRNAHKLSHSGSEIYRGIGIKHDMTKEEREKDNELKREAKERTEKDTENFIHVVRGMPWERKIVKIKKGGGGGAGYHPK